MCVSAFVPARDRRLEKKSPTLPRHETAGKMIESPACYGAHAYVHICACVCVYVPVLVFNCTYVCMCVCVCACVCDDLFF